MSLHGVPASNVASAIVARAGAFVPTAEQQRLLADAAVASRNLVASNADKCRAMVALGRALKDLRRTVPHGQWGDLLCSYGIHGKTAQRAIEMVVGAERHAINPDLYTNMASLRRAIATAASERSRTDTLSRAGRDMDGCTMDTLSNLNGGRTGNARDERVNGAGRAMPNGTSRPEYDQDDDFDDDDDDGEDFADEDFGIEPGEETGITAEEEDAIFGGVVASRGGETRDASVTDTTVKGAAGAGALQSTGAGGGGSESSAPHAPADKAAMLSTQPSRLSTVPASPSGPRSLAPSVPSASPSQLTFDSLYAAAEQARAAVLAIDVRGLGDEAAVRGFTSELAALAAKWGKKATGGGCGGGCGGDAAGGGREPGISGEHTG